MRHKKSFLLILSFFFLVKQNAQSTLPDIKLVVEHFYSLYQLKEPLYRIALFEKRKEGWWVITQKVEDNQLVPDNRFLIYDAATKDFLKVKLPIRETNETVNYKQIISAYMERNFKLHPYFGYKGWYKDVINEYEQKATLSEDELYSYARAYSNSANALLNDQQGDAVTEEIFNIPFKQNILTEKQIGQYRYLNEKAQAFFKKLFLQNPTYKTLVGDIYIKYSNEIMTAFHALLTHSPNSIINFTLPDKLYNDSILAPLRKRLSVCPQNAILLSYGDNDFYPVLYLQQKENLRKDVYTINYNLLGVDRYIFYCSKKQLEANPIQMTSDTNMYNHTNNDYVYLKELKDPIAFSNALEYIQRRTESINQILVMPGPVYKINNGVVFYTINAPRKSYILKNEWVLLDILNNLKNRKICFSQEPDELKGLKEQCKEPIAGFFIFPR